MYLQGKEFVKIMYRQRSGFVKQQSEGNAKAQYNLGEMHHIGQGVRQDLHLSKEWFGKACDGGVQEACNQYRYLNQKGY